MRPDLTKSQRRRVRELAALAHERELARELAALENEFQRWRSGTISAHDLDDQIHAFHKGAHRDIFLRYTGGDILEVVVASAIARGFISEAEAGPELVGVLRDWVECIRHNNRDGDGET